MRLIDADKLERKEFYGNEYCFDYVDAEDIDNAPTVDAVEVVHACRVDEGGFYFRCSNCEGLLPFGGNYCSNCGAKMDGGSNAEG